VNAVLGRIATAVERMPAIALATLIVITGVFGVFASEQQTDTDMTAFAPESELAQAHARIAEEFGQAAASVQVIVDAGEGGDVLSPEGLALSQLLVATASSTPQLEPLLADGNDGSPPVITWSLPVERALAQQGVDPASADDVTYDATLSAMLADPTAAAQVGALLSDDFEPASGTARAGLVIVRLNGTDSASQLANAELAFRDAVNELNTSSFQVNVFGENIFADELLSEIEAEMPVLLGIAFLLIIAILFITYRRISDVALGLTGLIVTIIWTYGIAVLLGPSYLGITGVMTQISIMIPVLLVGLGIDFAIHLTSRYREEVATGQTPPKAAHKAVVSVGGALVLATITTMVGFLTNIVSPLPPIRDFGIFVAGGVFSAFIVMLLLVPSARSLIDRRRVAKGTYKPAATGTDRGLGKVMVRAATLAERRPRWTLATAAVVTVIAAIAGSQVSTTFDQDDFVPPDSNVGLVLASMQELFGGDLDETTNVLVDGDLTSPVAANSFIGAQQAMGDTPNVRSTSGRPQVDSPVTVVATLAADPALGEQFAQLGFDGTAFADDADVAAIWNLAEQAAPQMVSSVLDADRTTARMVIATTAGQQQATALRDDLIDDLSTVTSAGLEVVVVSDFLRFEEALDALTESQTRGMLITLAVALLVLVGFFTLRMRTPMLGVIAMIPSALVVAWVAGSMWALGLSFNMMTAMVASLAIGIGVPYGIHITNRFTEDLQRYDTVDEAIRQTVVHTGGALVGSATTTAAGFGVLVFASLVPMQQFGIITAMTIIYSLIGAALIEPACLTLWARRREARGQLRAPQVIPG